MAGNGYMYETSPRKLEPEYTPKERKTPPKKSIKNNKVESKKVVNKKANKRRAKANTVLYLGIAFVILFTISYRNSQINESFSLVQESKKELSSIQKENEQLQVSIENTLKLSNLEQSAKEELGMQKLEQKQKVYVNLPKKDYVESGTEEIVIDEKQNIFERIINSIMNIFK